MLATIYVCTAFCYKCCFRFSSLLSSYARVKLRINKIYSTLSFHADSTLLLSDFIQISKYSTNLCQISQYKMQDNPSRISRMVSYAQTGGPNLGFSGATQMCLRTRKNVKRP